MSNAADWQEDETVAEAIERARKEGYRTGYMEARRAEGIIQNIYSEAWVPEGDEKWQARRDELLK